jgi:triphosphoribosyl-dephospho-CoA synthetase
MTIPAPSVAPGSYPKEAEMRWSKSERAIARKALDRALNQELQEVIQRAKRMAAEVKQPSDLWELEHHLTQRRKEINRKYEYRASKLSYVFGTLLHEGRLTEHDLRGLREDKLEAIRSDADFLRRRDEPI